MRSRTTRVQRTGIRLGRAWLGLAALAVLTLVAAGCDGDAAQEEPTPESGFVPVTSSPFPWTSEADDAACSDGEDNDGNGYADCADFACSRNLAVSVCGAEGQFESSPAACANGEDDDHDGLVDCADPDCSKNPFHDVCDKPQAETGCAEGEDRDGDGLSGCEDYDCLATADACAGHGLARVLFDRSLDETAALGPNSDWIVDSWGVLPSPSNPTGPDDWSGALSALGYALFASGDYLVASLPPWAGRLSWGDGADGDLQAVDVLVLVEPSRSIAGEEAEAIVEFVRAGGGLLLVGNHDGADRDGNGYSAPRALNELLDVALDSGLPFGFRFAESDLDLDGPFLPEEGLEHPVLQGPAGDVERIALYKGCAARLTGDEPSALGLIHVDANLVADWDLLVGASEPGEGRVVFVTDSALVGDGVDSHGNRLPAHDAFRDDAFDHRALFVNAVAWLARR